MKKKIYKKLTLTIAATSLLLPSTVTHAAEQTQNMQQTNHTTTQSDGLNHQSAPKEETPTQTPSTESDNSNTNESSQTEATTKPDNQTTDQTNNTTTNDESNTTPPTQEDTSQSQTKPQPNEQPDGGSTGGDTSQPPSGESNNTETDPTRPGETKPNESKPDETKPDEETPPQDNHVDKPDNNETDSSQGGGFIPQKGEGGSKPDKPKPDSSGSGETHKPEQPSVPDEPVTPEMPETPTTPEEPESRPNHTTDQNQSGHHAYQPNQQVTPISSSQPSADYMPTQANLGSAMPALNGGSDEHQSMDEMMPFSNFGLTGDRFGHLVTGSFKYNPFIVHQVGMISNDTHSTEDDVNAMLRPQNFSNNNNLNTLQQNTGYFKYQYFSPMRAQQYYTNLDLQILGLVTSDLGSMPDLKEIKREKKAEAEHTSKPSEDTKQNADKVKKSHEEKTTDNQKYPRLLNSLMIVFGAAFIWFIILMIMKRKKKSQSE
ncbi:SdrH family protein [Staphylococcus simulans]|uniref:SdrH family protein n=1 Tax=Staphylococcus simulans TaxID=1286 RepID=UPI003999A765